MRKLFSVKTWVTVWSMAMISIIVIGKMDSFLVIAQMLCAVPLAYLGVNVWQKKIQADRESEQE